MSVLLLNNATGQISMPQPSPAAVVSQNVGLGKMTIEYSRPALKGRTILGSALAPFGQVWRTGANKIPNLILSQDMLINGTKVAAGTYGLATIPDATEWTIIINKDPNQWGTYGYKQELDVLRFKVKAETLTNRVEYFTIDVPDFSGSEANVAIRWENTQVKFNVKQETDALIMAEIKEKTAAVKVENDTYFDAANYYYDTNRDLKQAFEWANKVVANDQKYWTYYLRAKIAAKMGNCPVAIQDAEKGLEMAKQAKDGAYVTNHTKVLKDCGKE